MEGGAMMYTLFMIGPKIGIYYYCIILRSTDDIDLRKAFYQAEIIMCWPKKKNDFIEIVLYTKHTHIKMPAAMPHLITYVLKIEDGQSQCCENMPDEP